MPGEPTARDVLRNLLQYGDLSFRDFVEIALYHPEVGYYSRAASPVGKEADFVTAPTLSPVFAYGFGKLVREFVSRSEAAVCSIVDIGCGDGSLIHTLYAEADPATPAAIIGPSETAPARRRLVTAICAGPSSASAAPRAVTAAARRRCSSRGAAAAERRRRTRGSRSRATSWPSPASRTWRRTS